MLVLELEISVTISCSKYMSVLELQVSATVSCSKLFLLLSIHPLAFQHTFFKTEVESQYKVINQVGKTVSSLLKKQLKQSPVNYSLSSVILNA